jgi:hypothetical protein
MGGFHPLSILSTRILLGNFNVVLFHHVKIRDGARLSAGTNHIAGVGEMVYFRGMLWNKLPEKILDCKDYQKRVLNFDPVNVPNQYVVRPYQRYQYVSVVQLFPKVGNVCGCGCGVELTGRQRRWATEDCQSYAVAVWGIIAGRFDTMQRYMRKYHGWVCSECGCRDKGKEAGANGTISDLQIDHIIPVKLGGGGCWLSNYQILCSACHVSKTNKDFNWNQKTEMPTLF